MTATGERLKSFAGPAERAPVRASRSRVIGWLKFALPLAAAALVAVVLAWPDSGRRGGFQISFTGFGEGEDGSVGMTGGQLQGVDAKGQPYTVTASLAIPDKADPQITRLEKPQADVTSVKGVWMSLRADRGVLDRGRHTLALSGGIDVFNDAGFEFHGQSALLDMKAGTLSSTEPVSGQGPIGLLSATAMRAEDRGRRLFFDGPVRVVIFPPKRGRA